MYSDTGKLLRSIAEEVGVFRYRRRNSICCFFFFFFNFKPGFSDQSYVLSCVFVFTAQFNNLLPWLLCLCDDTCCIIRVNDVYVYLFGWIKLCAVSVSLIEYSTGNIQIFKHSFNL